MGTRVREARLQLACATLSTPTNTVKQKMKTFIVALIVTAAVVAADDFMNEDAFVSEDIDVPENSFALAEAACNNPNLCKTGGGKKARERESTGKDKKKKKERSLKLINQKKNKEARKKKEKKNEGRKKKEKQKEQAKKEK